MKGEAGTLDSVDSSEVCGASVLGGLAVVCSEKDVSMLVEACVIEVESHKAANAIDDVAEKVKFGGI